MFDIKTMLLQEIMELKEEMDEQGDTEKSKQCCEMLEQFSTMDVAVLEDRYTKLSSIYWDRIIKHMDYWDAYDRAYGKEFCKKYGRLEDTTAIFKDYCDSHDVCNCFKLKYIDKLTAEEIAELENIDRRTVFKRINKEMSEFGNWIQVRIKKIKKNE